MLNDAHFVSFFAMVAGLKARMEIPTDFDSALGSSHCCSFAYVSR